VAAIGITPSAAMVAEDERSDQADL
jgi:hypothetical protein